MKKVQINIMHGDCRALLRTLPADSVHCVITSPPYWGLRDYGIPPAIWGGDPKCKHKWGEERRIPGTTHWNTGGVYDPDKRKTVQEETFSGAFCQHCGAWKGVHGLEPNIALYLRNAVEVFAEIKRVLRPDGTCWVNLGDSYATSANGRSAADTKAAGKDDRTFRDKPFSTVGNGLKPKDLCGIPWRVAFALQEDGWWLRQDIIWSKLNPMPESIVDRCTRSHEYLFMLTKSARYFYDAEAIKEKVTGNAHPRGDGVNPKAGPKDKGKEEQGLRTSTRFGRGAGFRVKQNASFSGAVTELVSERNKRTVWTGTDKQSGHVPPAGFNHGPRYAGFNGRWDAAEAEGRYTEGEHNKRSVWTISTAPYPEAHFATFPPKLVEPVILAGTSAHGCCAKCGAPWVRVIEKGTSHYEQLGKKKGADFDRKDSEPGNEGNTRTVRGTVPSLKAAAITDRGWKPTCDHNAPIIPCTVLDPFGGSGTTAFVADRLHRSAIVIDFSDEYTQLAAKRIRKKTSLLVDRKVTVTNGSSKHANR